MLNEYLLIVITKLITIKHTYSFNNKLIRLFTI